MRKRGELQTSKGSTGLLGIESHLGGAVPTECKSLENKVEQICMFCA